MNNIIFSTCSQGLIYAILALGVYITFRILNFADMTAEGSLTLGGGVCAVLISHGVSPALSLLVAGLVGSLAGLITGFFNTKLKIQDILAGILTMIALYSINLRIMGKANISLLGKITVFKNSNIFNFNVCLIICAILLIIMNLFFKTEIGLAIRATGDNPQMAKAQGINTNFNKILALMISNSLCAVSGALLTQNNGYADVNMGTGVIVIALSSIVIGEAFVKKSSFLFKLIAVIFVSICYKFIIYFVLNIGMNPSDLKLFTALVAAILLGVPSVRNNFKFKGARKNA